MKKQYSDSDSSEEPESFSFKVVLMGNSTTGKTSIIMRFTEDFFETDYK